MEREKSIELKYIKAYFQEDNSDNMSPGRWVCKFNYGKKLITLNRTKTLEAAELEPDKTFLVRLNERGDPIYVKGTKLEIIRRGSHIIRHDLKTGKYFNQTMNVEVDKHFKPLKGEPLSNAVAKFSHTALMNFAKGKMTESYLLNKNKQGVFFIISEVNNKKERKFGFNNISKNQIIIERETQQEIEKELTGIKILYLRNGIDKHFEITTSIAKQVKTNRK